jgi:hypothetical protein
MIFQVEFGGKEGLFWFCYGLDLGCYFGWFWAKASIGL